MFYYSFKIFLSYYPTYVLVDFRQNFGLFLVTVPGYKHADTPQKVDNIHRAICFAYFCISSIQFEPEVQLFCLRIAFLVHFNPSSLVSIKIVYHRSAYFRIKYTIESMVFYSHLPNMVSAGWLWRISREIGADRRQRSIFKWIISTIILKTTNLNIGKPRKICHHAEHLFGYSHVFFCSFLTMSWPIMSFLKNWLEWCIADHYVFEK